MGKYGFNGIYSCFMIAKLVNITPISLWFIVDVSILNGIINQLITGGAPPCMLGTRIIICLFHTNHRAVHTFRVSTIFIGFSIERDLCEKNGTWDRCMV